ncbi:MAG: DNA-binding protein [Armatimonadetes bacterium]|nr:DNA-binding protein [Armatimonadota bacterium]NIM22825.1 DNA-binding protein [Armatimonadota bacterium]NIM66692.1 DNA-binding protein [Armatimonadota bacterium]NIM75249.1 DNA-binding protein [Armatimonadota bacterium]NIN04890.1 DNA-binding protein [Armatimonadota bacterium]
MTKPELVEEVVQVASLKKKDAAAAVEAVLDSIKKALKKGDKVQIVGFGSFEVRKRKGRTGRNPRNPAEIINIPATKVPAFRPGKELKDLVAGRSR